MAPTMAVAALIASGLPVAAQGADANGNPLAKVIDLIHELRAKVVRDGEAEAKAFHDFYEWCDDASTHSRNAGKTHSAKKESLEAEVSALSSDIDASNAKIEDLAKKVGGGGAALQEATAIRGKEAANFAKAEGELTKTISALTRALSVLEKEMAKGPALAQVDLSSMSGLLQALNTLLDASAISGADHQQLVAFVQSKQNDDDEDDASGAPAAAVYQSKSGNILEVLEEMNDKAQKELAELRSDEGKAVHSFKMFKQSLTDNAKANARQLEEEKVALADAKQRKATATGELDKATHSLDVAQTELTSVQESCMTTASDHQATVKARDEEMKVLDQATTLLEDVAAGGASFIQVAAESKTEAETGLIRQKVARFVKSLAKKDRSADLAQLASHIAAVTRYSNDPFAKIKGLIQDMIAKLEKEGEATAQEKAWCDEQLSKTELKKSELDEDIEKVTVKVEEASAKSAQLKQAAKQVQADLAALAQEQADMDKNRQEENGAYKVGKADLERSVDGVRKALKILKDYYGSGAALIQQPAPPQGHAKASGAGGSIVDILELCESDFAENLAKVETEEADAVDEYNKVSQSNKVTRTSMEQDVKYMTQEYVGLDKSVDELNADGNSAKAELSSVMQYYGEIRGRCIAKPDSYADRAARRQDEIDGLKQALQILNEEAAFVQTKRRGNMRGALELN